MSKKLDQIRKKIDALDHRIHDTLMERAALIMEVAAEKKKSNLPFVQPAREAQMIRRLLARHTGNLPAAAVVRIWRELVGAVSLMQTGLKVAVTMDEGDNLLWDLAKSYFGSVVPMQRSSSPLAAIALVRENEASFSVLPWPRDEEGDIWWPTLFNQENSEIKIVGALPYGWGKDQALSWEDKGLIISKIGFQESGEDHSFIVVQIDQEVSRGRIVDALRDLSFDPLSVFTKSGYQGTSSSLHLIELNDFVADGDERLAKITRKFEEYAAICMVLGGYPVPPVYEISDAEKQGFVAPPAPGPKAPDK